MTDVATPPESVRTTPAFVTTRPPGGGPGERHRLRLSLRIVALYLITLWAVVTLIFFLPRVLPGDPLQQLEDPTSPTFVYDARTRQKVAAYYGLDKPLVTQYRAYLVDLSHGDLGWSIAQNRPVRDLLRQRLPWTLLLMGGALTFASVIGYLAGLTAAWKRGGALDRAFIVGSSMARAVPDYAVAIALLMVFAIFLPVLPQAGAKTPFAHYPTPFDAAGDALRHAILPVAALTGGLAANKFLIARNTAIATLGEDYMLLARAKGLPRRLLKYRHVGRNTLLPFVTVLGVQVGQAVGGSLLVEQVFAYPGMGTLLSSAVTSRDYPLLQGGFLLLAVVTLAANLLIELVYARIDPRAIR